MIVTQTVRWCVPQSVLDVANSVDWNRVQYPPKLLAEGLGKLITKERLPTITKAPARPANSPALNVAADLPQEILDLFNAIDWTKISPARQADLAARLAAFIFGPLVQLPRV
jgi:hypothetical protein